MSSKARVYIATVLVFGTAVAAFGVITWTSSGLGAFAAFFFLCLAASLLRVVLPGIQGNLSLNFVLLIWGIVRLGLGETIVMGCVSAIFQSYWRCEKKPRPVQVLFNLALISLSVGAGKTAFSASIMHSLAPGEATRVLIASAVYFLVNTGGVAAIIALTENRGVWPVWRVSYLWTFPHYLLGASIVVAIEALHKAIGLEAVLLIVPAAYLAYHAIQMHIAGLTQAVERAEIETRHAQETSNLHLRTIRALAVAIEAKDRTTGEHLHRVQTYALELGKDFALSRDEMEALRAAAILHDIGKIAVPEHIISKPAKLTPEEFSKMKIHTVVGAEIVDSVEFPFPVARLVRAHHEKWDGTGYPDGLKAEQIPVGARILTAVDCLDALASDRQYRKAMPLDRAMAIIRAESGKSFDPRVVDALEKRCYELELLAKASLDGVGRGFSTDIDVERGRAPDAGYASGWDGADGLLSVPREIAARERPSVEGILAGISRCKSLPQVSSTIRAPLRRFIPFDSLALYLKSGQHLRCAYAEGRGAEFLSDLTIPFGIGISGWVAANGRPLVNGNALTEFGMSNSVPAAFDLRSGLAVPMDSEGGPFGVLTLYSCEAEPFNKDHLRVLMAIQSWLGYCVRLGWSEPSGAALQAPALALPLGDELQQLSAHVCSTQKPVANCEPEAREASCFSVVPPISSM
jgi:putative nucleotidyltransferase with HDIG domain